MAVFHSQDLRPDRTGPDRTWCHQSCQQFVWYEHWPQIISTDAAELHLNSVPEGENWTVNYPDTVRVSSPVHLVTWSPVSHFIHTWAIRHKYLGVPKLHHHILAAPAGRHLPPSSTVNKTSRDRVETRRWCKDLWENCQPEEKDETRKKYQITTWRASEDMLYKTQILIMTKFWGKSDVCSA